MPIYFSHLFVLKSSQKFELHLVASVVQLACFNMTLAFMNMIVAVHLKLFDLSAVPPDDSSLFVKPAKN